MALVLKDRVKEQSTTTGTGALTLSGPFDGYQAFSVIGNGNVTYYTIYDPATGDWEVGYGTYTASGTTLSRDVVYASSNSGSLVPFVSGTKEVFCTYPAEKGVWLDSSDKVVQSSFVNLGATGTATINAAALTTGTVSTTPVSATDIANKQYVDTLVASGITYHSPVKYEVPDTTGNLTATYNNGASGVGATLTNAGTQTAFTPDGIVASVGDRVLVYNQTAPAQNGVYTVTTVGSGSTNWVLTRATDANSYGLKSPTALGEGDAFFVTSGNTGAGETYVCNTVGTITFGTTAITFTQVSSEQIYSAGTGLTLTNTTFSLSNTGTAGTYGSASQVPVLTTNAQGQVTSVTNMPIDISASQITSGTLAVARGGTGLGSYAVGDIVYASGTGTLASLADTVTGNVLLSGGTNTAPSYGKVGLATHVSGTLPVANGGTGQTTAQAAINSLAGAVTSGYYLRGNGTNVVMAAIVAGDVPTLNQNTTGSAGSVVNALTMNNGGAGDVSGSTYNGSAAKTISYNTIGASPLAGSTSLTTTGTVTTGTWSGLFGAVSGANLTNLTAGNLSGTIPSAVLGNSTVYIGTTSTALNRASANQALTGISSVTLPGSTSGTVQVIPAATAGTGTVFTIPATTGTAITSGDTGTVTNTMLAGSIANAKLANSSVTINGSAVSLGGSITVTATASNALTIGSYLTGGSYNGSAAVTIAADATSANTASKLVARDASGNFSAGTITATLSGNASTATTATNATNTATTDDVATATTVYPTWVGATSGNNPQKVSSSKLTFIPSTGVLAATTFSGSGASLTSLPAGQLSGTIPSAVLGNSTTYVGTTAVTLNRSSANLALTGISSVTLPGSTSGTVQVIPAATAGTGTVFTIPATTGTAITSGDTGTVTNTMLAGSIANAKLANSSVTINGSAVSLGGSLTVTATATNALTISSPLSGTSYNGSTAVSIGLAAGYGDTQNPFASKTANYFLAAPNGAAGAPTFRAIVAADIPTLNQNTTGSSGSCTGNSATATTATTATNQSGGTVAATTGSFSGQITSTVATGTAPMVVASTTKVANLNVEQVDGYHADTANTASTIAVRDASKNLALSGVVLSGSTSGTTTLVASAAAGTTTATLPATTGTLITTGDTGTVTNTMLAGSIANAKLDNSSVTINGSAVSLGGSITVTATATNALTISSPLSGTSYNGSAAVSIGLAAGYGDTQNPYASKTANYVLAAPSGVAGVPTFRAIVAADIPTLNQNTTGTAAGLSATLAVSSGGTGAATLTGLAYGNGTSAFTAATAAQIVSAISTTAVTNATNATNLAITDDVATATSTYLVWSNGTSGNQGLEVSSTKLTMVPSTGTVTSAGNFVANSDERIKTNWRPVQSGFVAKLATVKSGVYDRTDVKLTQAGVSAQSWREILPETVQVGDDGILSVAYGNAALVAVVELSKEVVKLREELEALKSAK